MQSLTSKHVTKQISEMTRGTTIVHLQWGQRSILLNMQGLLGIGLESDDARAPLKHTFTHPFLGSKPS